MRLGCLALAACRVAWAVLALGLQPKLPRRAVVIRPGSERLCSAREPRCVRLARRRALVVREMALTLPLCAAASHPPTSRRVAAQGSEHKSPRRHPE